MRVGHGLVENVSGQIQFQWVLETWVRMFNCLGALPIQEESCI